MKVTIFNERIDSSFIIETGDPIEAMIPNRETTVGYVVLTSGKTNDRKRHTFDALATYDVTGDVDGLLGKLITMKPKFLRRFNGDSYDNHEKSKVVVKRTPAKGENIGDVYTFVFEVYECSLRKKETPYTLATLNKPKKVTRGLAFSTFEIMMEIFKTMTEGQEGEYGFYKGEPTLLDKLDKKSFIEIRLTDKGLVPTIRQMIGA